MQIVTKTKSIVKTPNGKTRPNGLEIDQVKLDRAMLAALKILREHGVTPKTVRGEK